MQPSLSLLAKWTACVLCTILLHVQPCDSCSKIVVLISLWAQGAAGSCTAVASFGWQPLAVLCSAKPAGLQQLGCQGTSKARMLGLCVPLLLDLFLYAASFSGASWVKKLADLMH